MSAARTLAGLYNRDNTAMVIKMATVIGHLLFTENVGEIVSFGSGIGRYYGFA